MKTAISKTTSPALQQKAGNPFFGKDGESFFGNGMQVQAKLTIGKPNDPYEKEADTMADNVVQRLSIGDVKKEGDQGIQTKRDYLSPAITPVIQPKCRHCEEEEQQEKEGKEKVEDTSKLQRKTIFESNADLADEGNTLQRKCLACAHDGQPLVASKGLPGLTTPHYGGVIQRSSCRECEEGDKVLMKPLPGIQRSEIDQTPKADGSRTSIVAAAKGELGKVEARLNDGTGQRVGAERLLEYFRIAAPGVWEDSIISTAGVKMPSWCGIFSVWAHKKAGKDVGNWEMGKGVSSLGKLASTNSPQPGDIGYIHKPYQHHAIVKEIQGDNVLTIDGNSGMNSEVKENKKPKSEYTGFLTAFGGGGGGGVGVQKKSEEPEEPIQSKGAGESTSASPSVESRINHTKGAGSSLPEQTRQGMEQSFAADFSNVRIHTGSDATQLSQNLHAQAFTQGNDIYFNSGKFSPDSEAGKHLLAHELTHVIQQKGARQPTIQNKDQTTLCDPDGKNRPKSIPNAASVLTSKYMHLAKVISSAQLDKIQKCLDAQYKISELLQKQKPFRDRVVHRSGIGGASTDVAQYKAYNAKIAAQETIISSNNNFYIDSKLLAADDIKRPIDEDNEAILAFHEQLYKRFTEVPVRITLDPCQVDEQNNVFNIFLKFEWEAAPRIFWRLGHYNGLITFRNLMAIQKWNFDYQKVVIGEIVKILEKMVELRREIGDTMIATGKKIGIIHRPFFDDDIKVGNEIGSSSGYVNDGRGYQSMYKVLMDAQFSKTARVVLLSESGWLHIFAIDPNFDTLEMTSPDNDGNLYVLDKGRAAGINVYEDYFFTKDGRRLKPGAETFSGKGWSTPQELSELEEFAIGAILGDAFESNSGTATFGQIVIGLIPIVGQVADARDVCVGIHKIWETGGKEGKLQTGFALIGFVPLFGDWIKSAAKVGKNAPDAVKVAAKTEAVTKGSQKMGEGVSHTSAKKIEKSTDAGGKKAAQETMESLPKVEKPFVESVMKEAGKVTEESVQGLTKTDSLASEAAAAHGRKLTDIQNPKVLAESSFKIGEAVHSVKVVEIGNMKQLWLCSTCGSLVGKIDEVLAGTSGDVADKLRRLRDSAADLERKVTNGEVRPQDIDKKVGRITFELNDLARKNPKLGGLTKMLREDLERQYKLAYRVNDIAELSDGAKEALARNYRPTPPGYHWRLDGKDLQVVRNPDGVTRSKLIYDEKGHRFIVDEGGSAASKRFGDLKAPEVFAELGGKDKSSEFGRFVTTVSEELGIPPQRLIDDLAEQNAKGFKDLTHDAVRHRLKAKYVEMLFAKITNVAELAKTPMFKQVMDSTGDINKALRAASHEELMKVSAKLGSADKGSLGERWFKEWFASRGETVKKQVTLGPEHGIKHAASRRVDIYEDHLAREMKNVTGHVGKEGTDQLEDLMSGIGKKVIVDGAETGYDSVRWVFLDPVGGAANAGWMVEQLGKYSNSNLSFQILNKQGVPKVITPSDFAKHGDAGLKKIILDWTAVKPKSIGTHSTAPEEREADAMADKVVQRQCASCEKEEMVQKKETAGTTRKVTGTESKINSAAGHGGSLPDAVSNMMGHAFGYDFSNVRIHNDASANQLSRDLNARAFTHGNDVYFNSGQYDTSSDSGKHLLAHELTHVVQQSDSAGRMVQKDDAPETSTVKSLYDSLLEYHSEHSAMVGEITDNEEKARVRRELLLLEIEMESAKGQTGSFATEKDREETVSGVLETISENADSERTTMEIIINAKELNVTPESFLDNQYFLDNINAFPNAFWEILSPLIAVHPERIMEAEADFKNAARLYQTASAELANYMFEYGLPVSYSKSLELYQYELIKSASFSQRLLAMMFYKQRPTWESDLDFLIMPEEKKLHAGYFQLYQSAWTNYVIKQFTETAYKRWLASYTNIHQRVLSGNIPPINIVGLKAFKEKFPQGLHSLDELMGMGGGSAIIDLAQTLALYQNFFDPESILLFVKSESINSASTEASNFIGDEIKRFSSHIFSASIKIQALEPGDRLRKAIGWSLDKGFAKQSIEVLIDNFDDLVIDMLKEMAEESILKKVISFIVSLHPIGRVIAIAYTIYETSREIKEAVDTVAAIQQVAGIIEDAKNSVSVVQTQRASAQLAFATIELIPIIIEKLSSAMAKKLRKGAGQKPDVTSATDTPGATSSSPATSTPPSTSSTLGKTAGTTSPSGKTGVTGGADVATRPPDTTTKPDAPVTPDQPDKTATNTRTKVHADPPKPVSESTFRMGNEVHTIRVVQIGGRKQIWVCTTCGNLVGKIDEAIAEADGDVKKQLERYRRSAADLEEKVNRGKVKASDIDKKVGRISFELNDLARKNPKLNSLNKILKEDLERQFLAANKKASLDELTPGAKTALAMGYRPAPPGYHWRQDDNGKLEVVRNPDGEGKSKLIYNDKEHRFEVDPGKKTESKRFDKNLTADEAFAELGGNDPGSDFGKFVNTVSKELEVTPADIIVDMARKNPRGFKNATHDTVRHNLKKEYVDKLFAKTKDRNELIKTAAYKRELAANNGDVEAAFKAASHAKMLELSEGMGASDKGSLGERWFRENYASRGEEVKTQAVLGPEHGIKHGDKRKVDIYEDHLAREVKNVTGSLGKEGAEQVEDLLAGVGKEIKVGGTKTGYDSVRLVFLDPVGGAANASWMTQQLGKFSDSPLSFQVMNRKGQMKVFRPEDLKKYGKEGLEKMILNWVGVQKKSINGHDNDKQEQQAERMADRLVYRRTNTFFGSESHHNSPFFKKYG